MGPMSKATVVLSGTGSLQYVPALVGTCSGDPDLVGTCSGDPYLVGTCSGDPDLVGTCSGDPDLVGTCYGVSSLVGTCSRDPSLVGTCSGDPSLVGTCSGDPGLVGTCFGDPALVGTCSVDPGLVGTCSGDPGLVGTCSGDPGLVGTCSWDPGLVGTCWWQWVTERSFALGFWAEETFISAFAVLTHTCPHIFLNTKYTEAKSLPVLANGGIIQETTGRNTQPYLLRIKEVLLRRSMSAGWQNYTQLKQPNKTSCVSSCIWDGGYEWVNLQRGVCVVRGKMPIKGIDGKIVDASPCSATALHCIFSLVLLSQIS